MTCSMRWPMLALIAVAVAAVEGASGAHTEFLRAQQTNTTLLREYTWKSRTELRVGGEVKNVMLEQVRYDFDGALQKTRIGGESSEPQGRARRGGPIGRAVVARKIDAFKDLMEGLAALAASYANLRPDTLQAFANHAVVTKGEGSQLGTVRMHGEDVLRARDSLDVWIDARSFAVRRVDIVSQYDMSPVYLVADYRSLDGGPTYQARSVLRYPEKRIELVVENFDYERMAASH